MAVLRVRSIQDDLSFIAGRGNPSTGLTIPMSKLSSTVLSYHDRDTIEIVLSAMITRMRHKEHLFCIYCTCFRSVPLSHHVTLSSV